MTTAKGSIRQERRSVIRKGLCEFLPTSVQKSYFLLSNAEREVLNSALEKYQPGESEPILVGGNNLLKPALRLMSDYRVVLEEVKGAELVTTYTRWLETVQVRGVDNQEVYLTFSIGIRALFARKPPGCFWEEALTGTQFGVDLTGAFRPCRCLQLADRHQERASRWA
jgi:hypothetical protein